MYLVPGIKPVWVLSVKPFKVGLIQLAMALDAIFYSTDSNDIGRQFFNRERSFEPFGKHKIMHCLKISGRRPLS